MYVPSKEKNYTPSTMFAIFAAVAMLFAGVNYALANHQVMPDTNEDGFISVVEGIPFYGGIAYSLTTEGLTGSESALALDRFPIADKNGKYRYVRTFVLDENAVEPTTFHVVVHGVDLDNNGVYDGEKRSSLTDAVPFEATVPAACGVVELNGKSDTYRVKINELNSTGAAGNMLVQKDGNKITVKMNMKGLSPEIAHAQHFHMGGDGVCPPNTVGVAK